MNRKKRIILCLLSSLLLSLGWFSWFTGLILIFAFIPLLLVEDHLYNNKDHYKPFQAFLYGSLTFIAWNAISVYWIYHATLVGAIAAVLISSLLMSTAFWLFHVTHRRFGNRLGYISFLIYWIAFEHFYLNAELSFPWLNLGNGLAKDILFIQWFDITGSLGGTLWLLMTNMLIFLLVKGFINNISKIQRIRSTIFLFIVVFLPMIFSILRFYRYQEDSDPRTIVVVQPNIDPYKEKFGGLSNEQQLAIILELVDSLTSNQTDYIVGPETAVDDNIWENYINHNPSIVRIRKFIKKFPDAKFVIGLTTFRKFEEGEVLSPTAREFSDFEAYYDIYNAAGQIDTTLEVPLYHKSKLVTGVEKMPYPGIFKFLEKLIIDLGGTTGSYGTQTERSTLDDPSGNTKVGTAICYESVYGEYFSGYIRHGANLMFVITNDGWWGNTAGYRQHLTYSSLRAIETRRSIARSANTGISCFINQKGEIIDPTEWWRPDVIQSKLNINNKITFYVRFGDYIGRISDFLAVILMFYLLVNGLMNRAKKGKS